MLALLLEALDIGQSFMATSRNKKPVRLVYTACAISVPRNPYMMLLSYSIQFAKKLIFVVILPVNGNQKQLIACLKKIFLVLPENIRFFLIIVQIICTHFSTLGAVFKNYHWCHILSLLCLLWSSSGI